MKVQMVAVAGFGWWTVGANGITSIEVASVDDAATVTIQGRAGTLAVSTDFRLVSCSVLGWVKEEST